MNDTNLCDGEYEIFKRTLQGNEKFFYFTAMVTFTTVIIDQY